MDSVLISSVTGIGNYVLKTPFIQLINDKWPKCNIDIITGRGTLSEEITGESKLVDNYIYYDEKKIKNVKLLFFLFRKKYDIIFMPFDSSPILIQFFSIFLPGRKVFHNKIYGKNINPIIKALSFLTNSIFNDKIIFVDYVENKHEIELNIDLFESIAKRPKNKKFEKKVYVSNNLSFDKIFNTFPSKGYLFFQTAAASGYYGVKSVKIWSKNNYIKLIDKLLEDDFKIVISGSKSELNYNKLISKNFNNPNLADLTGKHTLAETIQMIKNSFLVLTPDSGLMHVADALKVKLLAIYGPTDLARTSPSSKDSYVLKSSRHCLGCLAKPGWNELNIIEKCEYEIACMNEVTVDMVYSKIKNLSHGYL